MVFLQLSVLILERVQVVLEFGDASVSSVDVVFESVSLGQVSVVPVWFVILAIVFVFVAEGWRMRCQT